ncbi:MAG: EAL domain-containing protein [Fimbriimonadaceae bacterium]|nr:MAG: EAL domain-containing protein [Fimbriimonadaceae bacterium]
MILRFDRRIIGIGSAALIFVSLYFIGLMVAKRWEDTVRKEVRMDLVMISASAATRLDSKVHEALRGNYGTDNGAYEYENKKLKQILVRNENIRYVYTCYLENGEVHFGLDPTPPGDSDGDGVDDKSYWGDVYDDPPGELIKALRTGETQTDARPYKDSWGTFISGYTPIFNADGSVEAVVGVDLQYSQYLKQFQAVNDFFWMWILSSAGFCVAVGLSSFLAWNRIQKGFIAISESRAEVIAKNRQLEQLNETLDTQVRYDALTGLMSRAGFEIAVLNELHAKPGGPRPNVTLAIIDLDDFKLMNDLHSHAYGDSVLIAFGARLQTHVDGAVVGRFGGDEFVVMMSGEDSQNRLRTALLRFQRSIVEEPLVVDEHLLQPCTASIGLASNVGPRMSFTDLFRHADIAMYEAKSKSSGHLEEYQDWMSETIVRRFQIENDLRRAMEKKEFWMAIQPIVDMSTGETVAGEMLMRWTKADGTFVSPADFIPVAETTGMIGELGYWALETACETLAEIRKGDPDARINISVNVSARQLIDPEFVQRVGEIISRHDFHRAALWLELTESTLIDDIDGVCAKLEKIREYGLKIALDDFGTGYSSLSMMLKVPLDCLKVDQSFVINMPDNPKNIELTRTILILAKSMNLRVIAEGVETEEHVQLLRRLGCILGQGYFYSKPIPIPAYLDRLNLDQKAA